ncbi:hypothetical protein CEK28_13245 [Xenophilus sp. AP218F]|nr:DUF2909 family protein [Chromobacterium sp. ASV5]OWY38329.1 hypothetical protein CEK28_13245 [Xenophilus sp. AP218F]
MTLLLLLSLACIALVLFRHLLAQLRLEPGPPPSIRSLTLRLGLSLGLLLLLLLGAVFGWWRAPAGHPPSP